MKNTILRTLVSAFIFSIICGIVVSIVGVLVKWKTPTQFSDGFFWAGAVIIMIGFVSALGNMNQSVPGLQTSQSAVELSGTERFKLWTSDLSCGFNRLAFLGVSALLLFGMAYLAIQVGRFF